MDIIERLKYIREKKEQTLNRKEKHDTFVEDFIKNVGDNIFVLSSGYVSQEDAFADENLEEDEFFENFEQ